MNNPGEWVATERADYKGWRVVVRHRYWYEDDNVHAVSFVGRPGEPLVEANSGIGVLDQIDRHAIEGAEKIAHRHIDREIAATAKDGQ